tara:strand:- start:195 stop:629 length:435 start_codon:yes stop_codon:yes gene_type:complete
VKARPRFEIFASCDPSHRSQTIANALAQAFFATVVRTAHRDPGQTDPTAPGDDATDGHGTRQVICTGHQQQMTDTLTVKFVDERREIAEGVLRAVIETNTVWLKSSILHQPLGVLGIGPTAHHQWEVHAAGKIQANALSIGITS